MMQHGMRRIVQLDDKMNVKPFLDKYQDQKFNSPNDLAFAADGALYFTDPPYGFYDPSAPDKDPDKDPRQRGQFNGVYRYKDGKLTAVITDRPRPNSLLFHGMARPSTTSRTLRIHGQYYKYDVKPDGMLVNRQVFAGPEQRGG